MGKEKITTVQTESTEKEKREGKSLGASAS